jgi:hypothetical protein
MYKYQINEYFDKNIIKTEPLTIQLDQQQILLFEVSKNYSVNISTKL